MRVYDNNTDMAQKKIPHCKSCCSMVVQVQILRATAESFAVQTNLMLTSEDTKAVEANQHHCFVRAALQVNFVVSY